MDPRIRVTLNVIAEKKTSMQFGLKETSNLVGLSEAYLLRLFHREVGKTFRKYLREVRMTGAAELVKQSPRSIKEIALQCGYSDLSNFHRDFRIVHSTTPRRFRLKELETLARRAAAGK